MCIRDSRIGTAAITTRGLKENDMKTIVSLIDKVITNYTNESVINNVANEVNQLMEGRLLFNI